VLVANSHRVFPQHYLDNYRAEVGDTLVLAPWRAAAVALWWPLLSVLWGKALPWFSNTPPPFPSLCFLFSALQRALPVQVAAVDGDDWFALPRADPLLRANVCTAALRAGDLLLWDSRTVHCSSPGADGRPIGDGGSDGNGPSGSRTGRSFGGNGPSGGGGGTAAAEQPQMGDGDVDGVYVPKGGVGAPLLRAAVMVCMVPVDTLAAAAALDPRSGAANATSGDAATTPEAELLAEVLSRRRQAVELGLTTPHWPHKAAPLLEQFHAQVAATGEAEQRKLLRSPVAERLRYCDLGPHERSLVDGQPA
jgi:hypothetical protein